MSDTSTRAASPLGPDWLNSGFARLHRGQIIALAVIGLILGLIGLFFPGATLLTVALLFGSYLVVSGIFRIIGAIIGGFGLTAGQRWLAGILGLLVVLAGVFCLADPGGSIVVLAFLIGIGWVAEGIVDIVGGVAKTIVPIWAAILSGVVSILAGIVMFLLPGLGVASLVLIGSILLIVVALTTLFTLPRASKPAAAPKSA